MSTPLESYFQKFRENIVGINQSFQSPYGKKDIIYADWTASGRLYRPIEEKMMNVIGPYVANTHTETSITGSSMTHAYHEARTIIKEHVNASEDDVLITVGTGMTGAINKFQRILGLKVSENLKDYTEVPEDLRPVVFVTHMEHHSNQTSWLETIAKVEVIPCDEVGLVCMKSYQKLLDKYKDHPIKIAAVTACSNVTGIKTDYHAIAKLIHQNNGLCFVDFACSAPYVEINMHPEDKEAYLDAVMFSPHKFLGGPGASGVLIFNKKLYKNLVPDNPGGGTVSYTNPWGDHDYIDDIESREDGGTPGFLQAIKVALAIKLKDQMGVKNILDREHEINDIVFNKLSKIDNLQILAGHQKERLGVYSFYIIDAHYNLVVKLLNDRYGIQTRGGCSCAGTYGHFLLNVDLPTSKAIELKILDGCLIERPGWVRMSIHPTMTNEEILFICDAIKDVAENFETWSKDYEYNAIKNEFEHNQNLEIEKEITSNWFNV
ncbi:aminotransferase class V-fold PLP-dependent enzyme [Flavobacteriaceae bacterium S0825]|uniref:aminotransferase class V-fold PLP-dependent enzyme n=1 Tax=Gaetbulibacter sp. S0825 TaxID=2720084 RepID=UPI001430DADF|nr:aminotransferase class V-fold PLP-dependent enzyme [Gaetbulibacter sp. S0825]MCK0107765.1 aminotransferase class V-fold PLP-dependent enzyme [Flavobacteriaceae bacterium S0825]NIX63401.1 aminotransferase class V-fold PLP-dependent enzyme [Gaetbulibacter sp. S0825]